MIQFTAEDIKSFAFEVESQEVDDNDRRFIGTLTISFMDGTEQSVFLDNVRSGDKIDFALGDKDALIRYLEDNEIEL